MRWISGDSFADIAAETDRTVDGVLRIYGSVISYSLATLIEQAVAVLQRYLADTGQVVAEAVALLPEYLRFGVATQAARTLMAAGVRHRRAAVLLGNHPAMTAVLRETREIARNVINTESGWRQALGQFVFERTLADLGDSGPDVDPDAGPASSPGGDSDSDPEGSDGDDRGDDQAAEDANDGWSEFEDDPTIGEVIDHVRALVGNSLPTENAAQVIPHLLELFLNDEEIAAVLEDLGDVMVSAVKAAPPEFPLIDSGTVREHDYGSRLDEVTVDFDADLEIGLAPSIAETLLAASSDDIAYDDGDSTVVRLSEVRLRCVAQVRSELDHAEITEVSIGLADE